MKSRSITTSYEADDGSEPNVSVTVELDGPRHAVVVDDLDELGVPVGEQPGVHMRATAAYWAAERAEYLRSGEAERNGD